MVHRELKDKAAIIIAASKYKGFLGNLRGAITSARAFQAWASSGAPDLNYDVLYLGDDELKELTVDVVRQEVANFLNGRLIERLIVYFVVPEKKEEALAAYNENGGTCCWEAVIPGSEVISILCPETDGTVFVQRSKFAEIQKASTNLGHTMDTIWTQAQFSVPNRTNPKSGQRSLPSLKSSRIRF